MKLFACRRNGRTDSFDNSSFKQDSIKPWWRKKASEISRIVIGKLVFLVFFYNIKMRFKNVFG